MNYKSLTMMILKKYSNMDSGQRAGGEWAESVLVRGVFGSKKAHF